MPNTSSVIKKIRKRDGRVVDFEPDRIAIAAGKALKASGTANDKLAATICKDVLNALDEKGFEVGATPDIELIQDLVENSFIKRGLSKAAKLYILYRAQHDKMREGKKLMMDVQDLVASYIDREDWRVNENSNAGYSYASLLNHVSGTVIAHYTLSNIYPKEIADAHTNADFHLHDLSCGIVGYCAGWSLRQLLMEGFRGRGGQDQACQTGAFSGNRHRQRPANRLETAIQRQLPQQDIFMEPGPLDDSCSSQDADRDRQIVGGTLLFDIGRRQIRGDPPGWKIVAGVFERRLDPVLTLLDRAIRQPDRGKGRKAWG